MSVLSAKLPCIQQSATNAPRLIGGSFEVTLKLVHEPNIISCIIQLKQARRTNADGVLKSTGTHHIVTGEAIRFHFIPIGSTALFLES